MAEEHIEICLNCTLPPTHCDGHKYRGCHFLAKYGKKTVFLGMKQNSCGYPERSEITRTSKDEQ
jgi:hypothetical protein